MFRMSTNESISDNIDNENDEELLLPTERDKSHSTTNLETLMHIFKVHSISRYSYLNSYYLT